MRKCGKICWNPAPCLIFAAVSWKALDCREVVTEANYGGGGGGGGNRKVVKLQIWPVVVPHLLTSSTRQ